MIRGTTVRRRRLLALALLATSSLAVPVAIAQDLPAILGTDGNETINGTAAPESIYARAGNDIVNAGPGDDELDGGPGADVLNGGDGVDVVSYSGAAPLTVTLDGAADDGAAGEGDNVGGDVEDIIGADGDDKLLGNAAANTLDGGAGDDRITGGAGADMLVGGDGSDTIDARDGVADRVDCGPGEDTARLDRGDASAKCEHPEFPAATSLFRLNYNAVVGGRVQSLKLTGVALRSDITVACVDGCRPSGTGARTLVRRSAVRTTNGAVNLALPGSPRVISGAVIEVRVVAPGAANSRCLVIRFVNELRRTKRLSRSCSSATSAR